MTIAQIAGVAIAAAILGLTGCASTPTADRNTNPGRSFAAAHSDFTFTLIAGARRAAARTATTACPAQCDAHAAGRSQFATQVQRIADRLQQGARALHPEPAQRILGFLPGPFDVFVTAAEEPGAASSANGRIALSSGLGSPQPYDDWLAFVIAREMGHVIAGHHEDNSALSIVSSLVMNVLLPGSGLVKTMASKVGSELAVYSHRDEQALRADAIAARLLEASGFRLQDVALSLVVTPDAAWENSWSQSFRASSDALVANIRGAKLAGASGLTRSAGRARSAGRPDSPRSASVAIGIAAGSVAAAGYRPAATQSAEFAQHRSYYAH